MSNKRLKINIHNAFKKDYTLLKKRGYNMKELKIVMNLLINGSTLEPKYKDHQLKGKLKHLRDIHVGPDWIVLYKYIGEDTISFERTGTHSDLF